MNSVQITQTCANSLIDAHVHLHSISGPLDAVLHRAMEQGVCQFICNGSCEADWEKVGGLARKHPQIVPCFGLHPSLTSSVSQNWLETLRNQLLSMPSAVGEIGLDRTVNPLSTTAQENAFKAQIRLARELKRPIMAHCVRAWDWISRVFKEEPPLAGGVLLHAFSGSVSLVKSLSRDHDVFFSVAGNVLGRCSRERLDALRAIPRNRLLLETDSPYLPPPAEFRPFSLSVIDGNPANEPANLRAILRGIAALLEISESELGSFTWENGQFFLRRWGLG